MPNSDRVGIYSQTSPNQRGCYIANSVCPYAFAEYPDLLKVPDLSKTGMNGFP